MNSSSVPSCCARCAHAGPDGGGCIASDWGDLDFVVPPGSLAISGVPEFDEVLDEAKAIAPVHSLVSIDDLGVATAFLAHDAARRLITGETFYIDGGYHIID